MGTPGPLTIGLVVAIALSGIIGNHARDMYKEKKFREMYGAIFWAVLPIAVFAIFWVATEDPPVMARNIVLGIIGAALGAVSLIWGGYVVRDWSASAQPQQGTTNMNSRDNLASALDALAQVVANAPV